MNFPFRELFLSMLIPILFFESCNSTPHQSLIEKEYKDSTKRPSPLLVHKDDSTVAPIDTIEQAWLDGKLFYTTVIRLADHSTGFFFWNDNPDTSTADLNPSNREAYYQKIRKTMDPNELLAHRMVWAIPELRRQQNGDGGLYTVMTMTVTLIGDSPSLHGPLYTIDVKRDYGWRLGTVVPIPRVKVNILTKEIWVENRITGDYLTLPNWRKHKDD